MRYLRLIIPVFYVPFVTVLLLIADKKWRKYSALSPKIKKWIVGILYGLVAIFYTEAGGISISGKAVVNARDAAAIVAGLCFYPESGLIAGLTGGIERFLAGYRGVGIYTRTACAIATACAGVFSYILSKRYFRKEHPGFFQGILIGICIEGFHLLLTLVTHPNDMLEAFNMLRLLFIIQPAMNSFAIAFSLSAANLMLHRKAPAGNNDTIHRQFRLKLMVMMLAVLIFTVWLSGTLLYELVRESTRARLTNYLDSAEAEISGSSIDSVRQLNTVPAGNISGFTIICPDTADIVSGTLSSEETDGELTRVLAEKIEEGTPENTLFTVLSGEARYYSMYRRCRGMTIFVSLSAADEDALIDYARYLYTMLFVLTFALLFLLIHEITRKTVLNKLDDVLVKLNKISSGNLDTVLDVGGSMEFEKLSSGINYTVDRLKQMIDEANRRIDAEIEFAHQIQDGSLPSVFPPFPERSELDIFASMHSAKGVGGDLYDFFFTSHDKLYLVIADVSGKGIPAALFMMRSKTLIRALCEKGLPVSQVMYEANNGLCAGNTAGLFVTTLIACVDTKTGDITFANAGHNPPVLRRADGTAEYLHLKRGFVLAGMPDSQYAETKIKLRPGDALYMYTDGVTEAINENKEQYGEERLLGKVKNSGADAAAMCRTVYDDVLAFSGSEPQFDDITMLCFRLLNTEKEG